MLYKYKEAFSLRDEIGSCPKIEVEMDVTDESPFFIRLYHVKEEDKAFIYKEMKCLYFLGILKEGFLVYSNPVIVAVHEYANGTSAHDTVLEHRFSPTQMAFTP